MKNLIFIIVSLLCLTACQWDLDKFDLGGNVYDCEETCVNGVCDELKNECICSEGWSGKDCDVEEVTFEKTLTLAQFVDESGNLSNGNLIEAIEITKEGDYIMVGRTFFDQFETYVTYIAKVSSYGEIVWEKLPGFSYESVTSILQTSDGYFITLRRSLIKINEFGDIIWIKKYNTTISQILNSQDGNLLLFGSISDSIRTGITNYWISKINSSGEQIWETNHHVSRFDIVKKAKIIKDGILILSEATPTNNDILNINGINDIILVKTDLKGNLVWLNNYGGTKNERGYDLFNSFDNTFLIVGNSNSNDISLNRNFGESDAWIFEIDNSGNLIWQMNFGGSKADTFSYISLTNDNNLILCGYTNSNDINVSFNNGSSDFWLVKIDSERNIIWEKTYGTAQNEHLIDMKATPDGGFILVGTKDNEDIYIVKTDANGNI